MTIKIHLACDGKGRPLAILVTPGQRHDSVCARPLLERIRVPRTGPGRPRCRPGPGHRGQGLQHFLRSGGHPRIVPALGKIRLKMDPGWPDAKLAEPEARPVMRESGKWRCSLLPTQAGSLHVDGCQRNDRVPAGGPPVGPSRRGLRMGGWHRSFPPQQGQRLRRSGLPLRNPKLLRLRTPRGRSWLSG
ncbi:transposase [Streptomyces olindensis]